MRASRQWQSTDTTGGWSWDEFVPQNRQQRRINTRKFRAAKKGIDKSVEQNAIFNGRTLSGLKIICKWQNYLLLCRLKNILLDICKLHLQIN